MRCARRAVARRPFSERWSREALQEFSAAPWMWRREPASAGVAPQVIPRVPRRLPRLRVHGLSMPRG
eukprot:13315176-Alexandrium_andersonii.AAC.1